MAFNRVVGQSLVLIQAGVDKFRRYYGQFIVKIGFIKIGFIIVTIISRVNSS
jgi:hypothetical protein